MMMSEVSTELNKMSIFQLRAAFLILLALTEASEADIRGALHAAGAQNFTRPGGDSK